MANSALEALRGEVLKQERLAARRLVAAQKRGIKVTTADKAEWQIRGRQGSVAKLSRANLEARLARAKMSAQFRGRLVTAAGELISRETAASLRADARKIARETRRQLAVAVKGESPHRMGLSLGLYTRAKDIIARGLRAGGPTIEGVRRQIARQSIDVEAARLHHRVEKLLGPRALAWFLSLPAGHRLVLAYSPGFWADARDAYLVGDDSDRLVAEWDQSWGGFDVR